MKEKTLLLVDTIAMKNVLLAPLAQNQR